MRSVRKPPILARAHQHFDRTRFIGKILVDIAFTVRYHGHASSLHRRKFSSALCSFEPASTFLLRQVPLPALVALTALTDEEASVEKSEQGAIDRIDCDEGMQSHTDALGGAANHGRVLNGEHMPSGDTSRRACRRRGHHLGHGHCRIVQKARQSDLARPVLTEPTNPYATPTQFHQPSVQQRPPFSSRRSPNRPSVNSAMVSSSNRISR